MCHPLIAVTAEGCSIRRDDPLHVATLAAAYAGIQLQVDGFHRMLIKRFIYAVLDCRRDPSWILERLGRSEAMG